MYQLSSPLCDANAVLKERQHMSVSLLVVEVSTIFFSFLLNNKKKTLRLRVSLFLNVCLLSRRFFLVNVNSHDRTFDF